jgi:glycosyltransferase involved in cell wall biosynthesis
MVESILDEPTDCSTMEPQLRGDEASPVTLSVIIPMFDEADGVDRLFAELEQVLALAGCSYEIICVNDGSRDETLKRLIAHRKRNCAIKIINLSRNFGKDIALTAGMIYSCGSAVLPFDADLQDLPNLIPVMLERWREGYEIVNAVRRCREDGLLKRIGATLFYRLYNAIADMKIPPEVGDFRLIDRKVVDVLKQFPERARFMKGLFAWVGFRQIEIPFDRPSRRAGTTSWNFRRLSTFAIDGITAFSTVPLRIATYVGLGLFLLAILYTAFLIVRVVLVGRDTPGYASLMVTMLLFGGIQFSALGILGEYIGRIYQEVKRRPLFIIEHTAGFDEPRGE